MFGLKSKAAKQIAKVDAKLDAAYGQLAAGNRVSNVAEFHEYGRAYGVNTVALVDKARADMAAVSSAYANRRAERAAALVRGRAMLQASL